MMMMVMTVMLLLRQRPFISFKEFFSPPCPTARSRYIKSLVERVGTIWQQQACLMNRRRHV